MIVTRTRDILFDDFALLEKHVGRQQLTATSVNTNCDCASSPALNADRDYAGYVSPTGNGDSIGFPATLRYDDRDPN